MSTLKLGMVLLGLMLITCEISALKCWICSTDTPNSEFCEEKLDLTRLPQQRNWKYIECSPPKEPKDIYGQKMVSKCRIQIQSINGLKFYSRHCVAEAENTERNACMGRSVLKEVKMMACETCQEDGCNTSFSEKPEELNIEDENNGAIKTVYSIQLLAIGLAGVVAWLLF